MKSPLSILIPIFLILSFLFNTEGKSQEVNAKNLLTATFVSTEGLAVKEGVAGDKIHPNTNPVLHLMRTKIKSPKGTILLLSIDAYELPGKSETQVKTACFLNDEGFNVAVLELHAVSNHQPHDPSLAVAMKSFRLLKSNQKNYGLTGKRFGIMGFSAGGNLAARVVQKLAEKEQPDDLILISPSRLNATLMGSVFPAVSPPIHPTRLFTSFYETEEKTWIAACSEYSKTWKGYDGQSVFYLLKDSTRVSDKKLNGSDDQSSLFIHLKTYLKANSELPAVGQNPAAIAVEGYGAKRHAEKLALVAKDKFNLIFIGNSITHNFEKPEYQHIWNQFFAPRKALNLGTSGYRTENLIWNIQHGELEGQSPKVVILEIGTNNVDEKNYPTRHTAGQLAGGIETIVKLLREKLPDTKIIVLRCFPGCYGGPNPTSHRMILEFASDIVSKLADGKHIFYCDVNHVFLNMDGSINHDVMSDWLHPTPAGAKAWAQAMEPMLSELMGDRSLDTDIPSNTAIVPVSKLENDSYDWWQRHSEVLQIKDSINPQVVLIGNSITHFWGGEPKLKYADGKPRTPNGPKAWDSLFHNYRVLNLGFGWDRTQNVLWRLDHGELDGLSPQTVIISIGTNNTSQTQNARMNTASEIVEGIHAICLRVRSKVPGAKIILMAVFPREEKPEHPRRILINEINKRLEAFAKEHKITFVNIGSKMLTPTGILTRDIAADFCHPTEKGYQIWADEIRPIIEEQ